LSPVSSRTREGFDRQGDEGPKKFARELVGALPEDSSRLVLKEICCRTGMSVKVERLDLHEISGAWRVLFKGNTNPREMYNDVLQFVELLGPEFLDSLGKAVASAPARAKKQGTKVAMEA